MTTEELKKRLRQTVSDIFEAIDEKGMKYDDKTVGVVEGLLLVLSILDEEK